MRYHLIDALRGVAALWIVLGHAYEGDHFSLLAAKVPELFLIIKHGYLAVPMFFVISGFVIANSLTKDHIDGSYFLKFAFRRSIRLDPPYWASIILVVTMAWLSASMKNEVYAVPDFATILAHIFYLQEILGIPHISGVYWTLCQEIQFYLVFCGLLYVAQRIRVYQQQALLTVFSIASAISLLWPLNIIEENLYQGLFFQYWHTFLLGVFSFWSWKKVIPQYFFYAYFFILFSFALNELNYFTVTSCLTAIFIHECAKSGNIGICNWRWIQFLGLISYSLYLIHQPITGATLYVFNSIFAPSVTIHLLGLFVSTLSCIVFAYIFWRLFESWSIKLSKKVSIHQPTASTYAK
jgi:peptidoglycan/LPS O-acetylase OafA/YrhL